MLLDRGYPPHASLALVGNHFALTERQRRALMRATCTADAASSRTRRRVQLADLRGATLWLGGFNVLTTVEAAIAGSPRRRHGHAPHGRLHPPMVTPVPLLGRARPAVGPVVVELR